MRPRVSVFIFVATTFSKLEISFTLAYDTVMLSPQSQIVVHKSSNIR